uniref:Pentacotripeptide-repeat region of PRORP domain-containing protein n=1 Tax=Oryza rufipogon TaxID=4529 RepID=A0A0E0NDJ4_ORYRU
MARRLLLLHHLRRRYSVSVSSAEDMVVSSLRILSSASPSEPTTLPPPTIHPDPDATATSPTTTAAAAALLSPADRLRGVFLLKPPGRAALHRALSSTGIDAAAALSPEVLSGVVSHGNFSGAATVDFFDWAIANSKLPPSVDTCNIVIRALGRRKFFAFFEPALEIMRKNGVSPDISTLEIIIDSLIAARHVNTAIQLINTDHFGLGVWQTCQRKEIFTVLINCLCRRSHVGLASSLLQASRGETIDLDNHMYNEVIGGWARFGRVDKVEHFWETMLEDGLVPDQVSYCHLIEALGRANRAEEALQVFEKMVDAAVSVVEESIRKGFCLGRVVYGKLNNKLLEMNKVETAYNLFKKVRDARVIANSPT